MKLGCWEVSPSTAKPTPTSTDSKKSLRQNPPWKWESWKEICQSSWDHKDNIFKNSIGKLIVSSKKLLKLLGLISEEVKIKMKDNTTIAEWASKTWSKRDMKLKHQSNLTSINQFCMKLLRIHKNFKIEKVSLKLTKDSSNNQKQLWDFIIKEVIFMMVWSISVMVILFKRLERDQQSLREMQNHSLKS